MPIKADIFDVRQRIKDQLACWVDNLCEDHDLHGPDRHSADDDARYLLTWLDRIESAEWAADMWDEVAETMSDAHALAPWRPEMHRCHGIPCPNPECGETNLAIFGGEEDVTCLSCRWMIEPGRYNIWTQMLADESARQEAAG